MSNGPGKIVGAKSAVCGESIYLYGGEVYRDGVSVPNNNLYQLVVSQQNLKM